MKRIGRRAGLAAIGAGMAAAAGGVISARNRLPLSAVQELASNLVERVSSDDDRSFSDAEAVKLLVVGDWGSGVQHQRDVAGGMKSWARREQPGAIISTGDNIYPSGVTSAADPLWRTHYEDVYSDTELQLDWYAALGNHDHHGSIQAQIDYGRVNPRWKMSRRYYSFTKLAGAVETEFFVLDTDPFVVEDIAFSNQQLRWLESQAAASRARWKVVVGHHPIRSFGHHGPRQQVVRALKPVLDRCGIDAYLCGHDHDLQILKNPEDRFTCIVSGAGGKARKSGSGPDNLFSASEGGFAYLAFTTNEFYVAMIGQRGQFLFSKTWVKEESGVSATT